MPSPATVPHDILIKEELEYSVEEPSVPVGEPNRMRLLIGETSSELRLAADIETIKHGLATGIIICCNHNIILVFVLILL